MEKRDVKIMSQYGHAKRKKRKLHWERSPVYVS